MRPSHLARGLPRPLASAMRHPDCSAGEEAEAGPRAVEAEVEPHAVVTEVAVEPRASVVEVSWIADCDPAGK